MSEQPEVEGSSGAPDPTSDVSDLTVASALAQAHTQGLTRFDAQLLLGSVLGQPRSWLIAHDQDALPVEVASRFNMLATRLAAGEPMAYLLGEQEFFGLTLNVGPGVLIPRPDTETLVDWALELIPTHRPCRVLDLGTGSGAIALALQSERPLAAVTAVDASPAALAIARANAQRLSLPVRFVQGSWFAPVAGQVFDLIVSNPPYIAEGDRHLGALRFEPIEALTAGPDGLDDLREIITQARAHLAPDGSLLLEHGHDQHGAVQALFERGGWHQPRGRQDLAGHTRCTGAQA